MELLVKLYSDKPCRIGIKFIYKHQATKPYEALLLKYPGETFHLKIEPYRQKLNLILQSENSGVKIPYKELDYKLEHFKKIEKIIAEQLPAQFVHIYTDTNTLLIAKPFNKESFITINTCEIISVENFR